MSSIYDNYEEVISACQDLTFESLKEEVAKLNSKLDEAKKAQFDEEQKAKFGLVNGNGKYTNLALLLSDQCPYTIKVAKFEEITKQAKSRYEYGGSVLKQFKDAYSTAGRLCNGIWNEILHKDSPPAYPGKSLEETILNAVVHRDYSIPDSILVKSYPNYVEVISPGGVPCGCTQADVMQGIPLLRNPKLAAIFQELGLVELLGQGIQHIMRPYAVKPQIKVTENVFKVKMFDNVIYGSKKLSEREIKIIEYLLDNQFITRSKVMKLLDVSDQTAGRCLKGLVDSKITKSIDNGKDTKYILHNSEYKVKEESPRTQWLGKIL